MQRQGTLARYAALVMATAITAGCAVVQSSNHLEQQGQNQVTRSGLVYSLPKGAVQLTAERKQVAAEDIKKAKDAAEAAKAKAEVSQKAWATSKENLAKAQGEYKTAPDAAKAKLAEIVALAQATVNYATVVKDADAATAKASQARYDQIADKLDQWIESVALAVLPNAPDPKARYVADLAHNATRDDNVKLSVANGMLTSSSATATDQLPNILLSVAQTIAAVGVKAPTGLRALESTQALDDAGAEPEKRCSPYNVSLVFDPTDPVDTQAKLQLLEANTPGFVVQVADVRSEKKAEQSKEAAAGVRRPHGPPSCARGECSGLYYRVPIAVETQIESRKVTGCDLKSSPVAYSSILVMPDSMHTYLMPTRAGAFTTSKMTFAFKEGMPVDYSVDQPSEIASIASIPVQIAKALISIPAEIIQLRVNHDTEANALIEAKTTELTAQLEQLRAQQALDAARQAAANGQPIPAPAAE